MSTFHERQGELIKQDPILRLRYLPNESFETAVERQCLENRYVYIPPGTYGIRRQINLPSGSFIYGSGESTVLFVESNINKAFNVEGKNDISFENFRIDATNQYNAASRNNYCFWVNNTKNFYAKNVIGSFGAFGFFIVNNSFENRTQNVKIENCILDGMGSNDVIGGGAFDSNGWFVEDLQIRDNIVIQDTTKTVHNYSGCIAIVNVKNTVFENNTVQGAALFSIEQSPHRESRMVGNRISGAVGRNGGKLLINFHDRATQELMPRNLVVSQNYVKGTVSITRQSLPSLDLPESEWLNGQKIIVTDNIFDCQGNASTDLISQNGVEINRFDMAVFSNNIFNRPNFVGNDIQNGLSLASTTNNHLISNNIFKGFDLNKHIISQGANHTIQNNKII